MNGGTCIDGVDNFTCSCPPMLTGVLCECLILDGDEVDCSYVSPSPATVEFTIDEFTTDIFSTKYDTSPLTYFTTSEKEDTSAAMTDLTDISTSSQYTITEDISLTTVPTTSWEQSTYSRFSNVSLYPTTYTSYITDLTQSSASEMYTTGFGSTTESFSRNMTATSEDNFETTSVSSFNNITDNIYSTVFTFTPMTDSTSTDSQSTSQTIDLSTDFKTESPTLNISPTMTMFENKSIIYSTENTMEYTAVTTEIDRFKTTVTLENRSDNEFELSSTVETTDSVTLFHYSSQDEGEITTSMKTDILNTTIFTYTSEDLTTGETSLFTETPTISFTPTLYQSEPTGFIASTNMISTESSDCSEISCLNGGTCIHSSEGPKVTNSC